jgi:hypothetical protein
MWAEIKVMVLIIMNPLVNVFYDFWIMKEFLFKNFTGSLNPSQAQEARPRFKDISQDFNNTVCHVFTLKALSL